MSDEVRANLKAIWTEENKTQLQPWIYYTIIIDTYNNSLKIAAKENSITFNSNRACKPIKERLYEEWIATSSDRRAKIQLIFLKKCQLISNVTTETVNKIIALKDSTERLEVPKNLISLEKVQLIGIVSYRKILPRHVICSPPIGLNQKAVVLENSDMLRRIFKQPKISLLVKREWVLHLIDNEIEEFKNKSNNSIIQKLNEKYSVKIEICHYHTRRIFGAVEVRAIHISGVEVEVC